MIIVILVFVLIVVLTIIRIMDTVIIVTRGLIRFRIQFFKIHTYTMVNQIMQEQQLQELYQSFWDSLDLTAWVVSSTQPLDASWECDEVDFNNLY